MLLQGRQVGVGGDDLFNGRAPPQVVQGGLALHAHAQEQDVHDFASRSISSRLRRSFLVGRPLPFSRAAKISPSGSRLARASFSRSAAGVTSSTSSRARAAETLLTARFLTRYWRRIGGCLMADDLPDADRVGRLDRVGGDLDAAAAAGLVGQAPGLE